ncbi:SDR family NAD(P)-dependent oxidoreductase [Pectobacterium versatile]|uniref:SDR family NAD(P)-dependent oxidoreductase n=1 Tax=Pectobacterium versatile TaxID=2488639 RepID=UPI000D1AD9C0|nr:MULTISPECIES: SDR family NAD(P)-dependent oxidoreductase [Pectobacterium]AVT58261.1 3-ketoacyl-ACP reductase [Pectobacterium versatile]MCL6340463.1 SDR family oxidoreductase [Pectobacterium carotovorum subsp. carotovorum]MCL6344763.1 SDR family oxidoreductase [Pectobacterium carotovorum subsp. carotovorum]
MLLQGKNVLITGTRRGMGRAMVDTFAANGANIYAHARQSDPVWLAELQEIAERHHVKIWPLCFDITDSEAMKLVVKQLMAEKRPIDALVNNAGIIANALFQMTSEEVLRKQFEVNFFSVFLFTQYIAKLMMRRKSGSIINISSIVGLDGNPGKSAYGASKAALVAMTKSIAAELGGSGIRANCIAPGIIDTAMLDTLPPYILEETLNSTNLKRIGNPSEVADVAVFLASDLSSYITGQVIRADGGMK